MTHQVPDYELTPESKRLKEDIGTGSFIWIPPLSQRLAEIEEAAVARVLTVERRSQRHDEFCPTCTCDEEPKW